MAELEVEAGDEDKGEDELAPEVDEVVLAEPVLVLTAQNKIQHISERERWKHS
jgi:hypothetical protein